MWSLWLVILALTILVLPSAFGATAKFEARDGDRIVFLGDDLAERAQAYGYMELLLTKDNPRLEVRFRNLGWHAATNDFMWPAEAGPRIKAQLAAFRPTVAILAFGLTNAATGQVDPGRLTNALDKVVAMVREVSPEARFVLIGPVDYAQRKRQWPTQEDKTDPLFRVDAAMKAWAEAHGMVHVSLARCFGQDTHPICDDHKQLNQFGYLRVAEELARALGLEAHVWRIGIKTDGSIREGTYGLEARDVKRGEDFVIFRARLQQVPTPILLESNKPVASAAPPCLIQFRSLKPGIYTLKIDGQNVMQEQYLVWQMGTEVVKGPMFDQGERLRQAIVEKNKAFCALWRPEVVERLFGKSDFALPTNDEQRAQLKKRLAEQEKRIAELRQPREHLFELVWTKELEGRRIVPLLPAPGAGAPATSTPKPKAKPAPPPTPPLRPTPLRP